MHKKYGYPSKNILIMEEIKKDEKMIIRKFGGILDKYSPYFFFALFERGLEMGGVIFELGWLCGKYDTVEISKRIRIISDFDYRWRRTTGYLRTLLPNAHHLPIERMTVGLISAYINDNATISLNSYLKS